MIHPDILRVMAELYTFTAEDLAEALDCPVGTVGGLLPGWVREGYVVRFKFRRTYLYALSTRGDRVAAKLPPVDPDERCLPIDFDGVCPEPSIASGCCPDWKTADMIYQAITDSDMIGMWVCPHCGHKFPVAVYNQH